MDRPFTIAFVEVGRAEIIEGRPSAQDVIGDDEEVMGDGEGRPLRAPSCGEPLVDGAEIGLTPAGGLGRFDEHRPEPGTALPRPTGARLAGALVAARTEAGPRGQVARAGEAAHVRADL